MDSSKHWEYFLSIEKDLEKLIRYIEPCEENMETFSIELARMLITSTQECDVILKIICAELGNSSVNNEQDYRVYLNANLSSLSEVKILFPKYNLVFKPFESWSSNLTPEWWTGNNKVKHERCDHFEKANLKNTLNSIAALFLLNLYLHRDSKNKVLLRPNSKILKPELSSAGAHHMADIKYNLPNPTS